MATLMWRPRCDKALAYQVHQAQTGEIGMTPAQRMLYQARLTIGRAFGLGGRVWRYFTTVGDGVSGNVAVYYRGVRSLSIIQTTAERLGLALPGQPVGAVAFQLNALVGEDIQAGAYVQSVTDDTLVFSIAAVDTLQGFPSGIAERATLPQVVTPASLHIGQGLRTGLRIGLN
jgi:hypothetical protein